MAKPILPPTREVLKQREANRRSYAKHLNHNRARKREAARLERERYPERVRERQRRWCELNPDKVLAFSRAAHIKFRERDREYARRWWRSLSVEQKAKYGKYTETARLYYQEHKTKFRAKYRGYYARHQADEIARANARRTWLLQAIPPWADLKAITQIYHEARRLSIRTGVDHHVDHVIPLRAKLVCGLHCENNLQILTAQTNLSKGNRTDATDD
jgi:hypothetical protein